MRCEEPGLVAIQGEGARPGPETSFVERQQVCPQLHLLSYNQQSVRPSLATFILTVTTTVTLSSHLSHQVKISDKLSSLYSSMKVSITQ